MLGLSAGDFLRGLPGPGFEVSVRVLAGALVFFTTTGGPGGLRELMEDPGRTLIELPGLCEKDGALLIEDRGGGSIGPVLDAELSRLIGGCVE